MAKVGTNASRSTKQRAAIDAALERSENFKSAQQLFEMLRLEGESIGLTTVYRNLQSMAGRGEVDVLRREDGEAIYRRCDSSDHHHHLVCRRCGKSIELENDEIERWTKDVAARHEFSEVTHDLVLFGTCKACGLSGSE